MSLSSLSPSLSLSLSHPCPCHCHYLCTPHPPCEQLLAVAERGAGSSWHVGAISASLVPITSSSYSMRAGAHSGSGGCCPVIPVVRHPVPVCLCSVSMSPVPHLSLPPFQHPLLSAASTCEQLPTAVEGAVVVSWLLSHPRRSSSCYPAHSRGWGCCCVQVYVVVVPVLPPSLIVLLLSLVVPWSSLSQLAPKRFFSNQIMK
jgi:hypothetical protein